MTDRLSALVLFLALVCLGCGEAPSSIPRVGIAKPELPASTPAENTRDTPDEVVETTPEPSLEELRGVWVTRWTYDSEADVKTAMGDLSKAGFNAVYFQVRGTFDAYYQSDIEPWPERLKDSSWDPLAVAVKEGHAQGLQVHAYLNTFPLWNGPVAPKAQDHAYHTDEAWRIVKSNGETMGLNKGYIFASPGVTAVRERVEAVARDIDARYDVDGIHLDYIRYPSRSYSSDAESVSGIAATGADRATWQRAQVLDTVQRVQDAVKVPVTAAVWGVYENRWNWKSVSEGNKDFYQDSAQFLATGAADATMPMIYWPVKEDAGRLDFRTLVEDHLSRAHGRYIYAGVTAEQGYDVAVGCVKSAREEGAQGFVLFDYRTARDAGWLQQFGDALFTEDAVVPTMPWRD